MLLAKRLSHQRFGFGCVDGPHHNQHIAATRTALMQQPGVIAHGFVGQSNTLAAEYHSSDFAWSEHAAKTAPLVEAQWAAAPEAVRLAAVVDAQGRPLSAVAQLLQQLQQDGCSSSSGSNGSSRGQQVCNCGLDPAAAAAAAPSSSLHESAAAATESASCIDQRSDDDDGCSSSNSGSSQEHDGSSTRNGSSSADNEWELFYRLHPAAKFFKERRYLLLEFPCLAPPSQLQHVVEIGAGCGSSILPVLRAQPQARATVTDVSSTCLQQLLAAMQHLGLDSQRVEAFTADGTSANLGQRLAGCGADAVLIMFTLSAVSAMGMLGMMRNAAAALRPGGVLCVRDHALFDMVQLRIPAEQCIARHLYRRGDNTLAYFYTTEELAGLARAAGLEVVECEYVCVVNRNRKTGQALRRVFVHGLFRKPAATAGLVNQE